MLLWLYHCLEWTRKGKLRYRASKEGLKGARRAASVWREGLSQQMTYDSTYMSVHVLTGIVQLLLKSYVLTGLFHDAAQGTLYFGQQPRTHLLKLTSGDTWS